MPFYVFDTRLNTLIFTFLTASETYNFAYGSLIILQLPLHLFISALSGWNEGLLMLIFIICGLIFHSCLFIETYFNAFTFNTLQQKKCHHQKNIS